MFNNIVARPGAIRYRKIRDYSFCSGLSTRPSPDMRRVLVSGASGYVGGRLVPELTERGYEVYFLVRNAEAAESFKKRRGWETAKPIIANALDANGLSAAFAGFSIDAAYYLIHSLGQSSFPEKDANAARNFQSAAEINGFRRIIYLGGLGKIEDNLSDHLRSRGEVADILGRGQVSLTTLRSGIIMGSGSASYEIIRNLAKKLPFILAPSWAFTLCQPIAIRDVICYLVGVLEVPETADQTYDIGGPDVLNYNEMLREFGRQLGRKLVTIPSWIDNKRFYAYVASLITPVPGGLVYSLLESAQNEVICQDESILNVVPFERLSFMEAVERARVRELRHDVRTSWREDNWDEPTTLKLTTGEESRYFFTIRYSRDTTKSLKSLSATVSLIGGKTGWFSYNWMWALRGFVDRLFLGVGMVRGKRNNNELIYGDAMDFWRVEVINEQPDSFRLLLRAEMKMPGRAWLEFKIIENDGRRKLSVTPYFYTNSFWGKVYWYSFLPFHNLIFARLIKEIANRSS